MEKYSVRDLQKNCQEQTQRYWNKLDFSTVYCYELFRRAFSENNDPSLSCIFEIYRPLVLNWIKKHPLFNQMQLDEDIIIYDSISQFVFAMRQKQFSDFTSIGRILNYFRKCVHTVIMLEWRKNKVKLISIDEQKVNQHEFQHYEYSDGYNIEQKIIAKEIWTRIEKILNDSNDSLLARLIFIQNMKPQQIVKAYPEFWQTTNDVRVSQQRIKRHIKNDNALKELLLECNKK